LLNEEQKENHGRTFKKELKETQNSLSE